MERVAQDGMRVRAGAGAASFRGKGRLETCLDKARAQVERLAQEREHPDPGVTRREQGARERATREREERVQQALEYLPQTQATKDRQRRTKATVLRPKVTAARVSTTDPQARVMKMPDGGFRPAYNVELATDSTKGIIVGVGVTSEGTDAGQAAPMEEQVVKRTGQHPKKLSQNPFGGVQSPDTSGSGPDESGGDVPPSSKIPLGLGGGNQASAILR